jgi:hypothetical protein
LKEEEIYSAAKPFPRIETYEVILSPDPSVLKNRGGGCSRSSMFNWMQNHFFATSLFSFLHYTA